MKNVFYYFISVLFLLFVFKNVVADELEFEEAEASGIFIDGTGVDTTTSFSVIPRLTFGTMYQNYEEISQFGIEKWNDSTPFIGIGVAVLFKKNFTFDIQYQKTATGNDAIFQNDTYDYESFSIQTIQDDTTNISREDYAIGLSYARSVFTELDRIVVSAGYKAGKTIVDIATRSEIFTDYVDDRSDTRRQNQSIQETQFEASGPTLGIAYGFPIGDSIIGVNFAYAWLDGYYTSSDLPNVSPGDASGIKFGLTWILPITPNLTVDFSVDQYEYTMDGEYTGEVEYFDNVEKITKFFKRSESLTIKEEIASIKASVSYSFDF